MTQVIAMLLPALVALQFFNHLHRGKLTNKQLISFYGIFALLINVSLYAIIIYLLGKDSVSFDGRNFVTYSAGALALGVILPLAINVMQNSISIEVRKNGKS